MEADFWHERWETNQLGFHERDGNAMLVANFRALGLAPGARVFVPLCGKTRDIAWLLAQGHRVAGAELSKLAVDQLFEDLGVAPEVAEAGDLLHYRAPDLDIFVGDIFALTRAALGPVDAVYDRAALVAFPEAMRGPYAAHLHALTGGAPQLLLCFEYDQTIMPGPPFSLEEAEVRRVHGANYALAPVASAEVKGGLKGKAPALETVWLLKASVA
ncbi:MAG: thiopurine S-methyltransferase [Kiloniellales bacterium]|nr:thiopurine S-methyltransferase [Kiloniellales bacterium]